MSSSDTHPPKGTTPAGRRATDDSQGGLFDDSQGDLFGGTLACTDGFDRITLTIRIDDTASTADGSVDEASFGPSPAHRRLAEERHVDLYGGTLACTDGFDQISLTTRIDDAVACRTGIGPSPVRDAVSVQATSARHGRRDGHPRAPPCTRACRNAGTTDTPVLSGRAP